MQGLSISSKDWALLMAKRGDPRSQRKYKAIRLTVLARDQYTCYYCNQPAHTVDHIIPVSRSTEAEAYEATEDAADERFRDKMGDLTDRAMQAHKDGAFQ